LLCRINLQYLRIDSISAQLLEINLARIAFYCLTFLISRLRDERSPFSSPNTNGFCAGNGSSYFYLPRSTPFTFHFSLSSFHFSPLTAHRSPLTSFHLLPFTFFFSSFLLLFFYSHFSLLTSHFFHLSVNP